MPSPAQARQPSVLQSAFLARLQAAPALFRGRQEPFAAQYVPAVQWLSLVQAVQTALAPLQDEGAQAGAPGEPAGKTVQMPSVLAPSAAVQTSQAPTQAWSQHTWSEQNPVPHSEFSLQAPPANTKA